MGGADTVQKRQFTQQLSRQRKPQVDVSFLPLLSSGVFFYCCITEDQQKRNLIQSGARRKRDKRGETQGEVRRGTRRLGPSEKRKKERKAWGGFQEGVGAGGQSAQSGDATENEIR